MIGRRYVLKYTIMFLLYAFHTTHLAAIEKADHDLLLKPFISQQLCGEISRALTLSELVEDRQKQSDAIQFLFDLRNPNITFWLLTRSDGVAVGEYLTRKVVLFDEVAIIAQAMIQRASRIDLNDFDSELMTAYAGSTARLGQIFCIAIETEFSVPKSFTGAGILGWLDQKIELCKEKAVLKNDEYLKTRLQLLKLEIRKRTR